ASGVAVSDRSTDDVMGFGRGFSFDVKSYLARLEEAVRTAGGEIRTGLELESIERAGAGYRLSFRGAEAPLRVESAAVILATGGFQASREERERRMPELGPGILLRSNPGSTGEGLRAALALGAATAGDLGTFYGHLIS